MDSKESIKDLEQSWIEGIRSGDEQAFEAVFYRYFSMLTSVAADYVGSYDTGKEIAHDVLVSLWERGANWQPNGPLKPYLCQAVIKRSITIIRKESRQRNMIERYSIFVDHSENDLDKQLDNNELKKQIWSIVRDLPPKRYKVFVLHKRYDLSYKEISQAMDISIKTVENQMSKALKYLRDRLKKEI